MSPAQSDILKEGIHLDEAEHCTSEINKGEALVVVLFAEGGSAYPIVDVQFRGTERLNNFNK